MEDVHSYSESDFFDDISGGDISDGPVNTAWFSLQVDSIGSESRVQVTGRTLFSEPSSCDRKNVDSEEDGTWSDCHKDPDASHFKRLLAMFDEIVRDVDISGATNINSTSCLSKPCEKVYPFCRDVSASERGRKYVTNVGNEKFDAVVSSDDDRILVELLRHAWFVLMLYILIKVYFNAI